MKIVFAGGGTGGHFYPLIAVAEEITKYALEHQLVHPKMYYLGPSPYDKKSLYQANITYIQCSAGKLHRMKDLVSRIKNFFSLFSIAIGLIKGVLTLYSILPDVVFSKGGYASFPVLLAAKFLRIPVVIHESDASMGRVNRWSANFAQYIAVAYGELAESLPTNLQKKVAIVSVPIRKALLHNPTKDAYEFLRLKPDIPTILVMGGSSGAVYINDNIIDVLPKLLKKYQVIHQTGKNNFNTVSTETKSFLAPLKGLKTYLPVAFLNPYQMRSAYTAADLVITRAGSTALAEIAEWGIPSIVIPIRGDVSHDQIRNAYAYSSATGAIVIEEKNLLPNLLLSQIDSILGSKQEQKRLSMQAKKFATNNAAGKIASVLVRILKSHTV